MAGILSTYALIAIHILSYILGGLTFSASFPSAVQQFRDAKKQMVASGLLNIAYVTLRFIPAPFRGGRIVLFVSTLTRVFSGISSAFP